MLIRIIFDFGISIPFYLWIECWTEYDLGFTSQLPMFGLSVWGLVQIDSIQISMPSYRDQPAEPARAVISVAVGHLE
jgi:hypothetical protein